MHEHPALALREKKDASILVACDLVRRGEADAVVTAGHTGAGDGRRGPPPRPAAGRRPPGPRGPDGPRRAARSSCSTSAPTPTRRPRTSPSTPAWGRSSPSASLGIARPARRAPLDRRGEGQGRPPDPAGDRAPRRLRPQLRRQRRGQGPRPATWPTSSSATRSLGNVVIKFFEGLVDVHLRPLARRSSGGRCGAASRTCSCGPGSAGSGDVFDYESAGGSPLLGVRGTVIITHGRAKRRMIGFALRRRRRDRPDAASRS